MKQQGNSWSGFWKSLGFALQGLKIFFRQEPNGRTHLMVTLLVLVLGFLLKISSLEWISIIVCIVLVFMAEIFNTALENLCDVISPEIDPRIKIIKDLSAAAVLVSVMGSVACGLIVFIPRIYNFFSAFPE